MACMQNCAKWILYLFNLLLFIVGCVGLGIGLWVYIDDDAGAGEFAELTGTEHETGALIMIVASGIVMFISFMGCCGAKYENRCCLGVYFIIMLLLLMVFVAVCVLVFAFKDKTEDFIGDTLEEEIQDNYGQTGQDDMTKLIDKIQSKFECCGVKGNVLSGTSWIMWQSSKWYRITAQSKAKLVPESCCIKDADLNACQSANAKINLPPQLEANAAGINGSNNQLYEDGCIEKFTDLVSDHYLAVGIVSAAAFVIILFCVITSITICQRVSKEKNNVV